MQKIKIHHILISIMVIAVLLVLNFKVKPQMKRQGAIKTVNEVLDLWVGGNIMASAVYWEKQQEFPPLYGIKSYTITEKDFYKKDSILYAKISASLEFSQGNLYANKNAWTFILKKNVGSWKVENFYPSDSPPEE